MVGRVIGRQGRTLKMIQSILCVKLSIFQGNEPCTVNIYGTSLAVERATWVLEKIVQGVHPIDVLATFFGDPHSITPLPSAHDCEMCLGTHTRRTMPREYCSDRQKQK